MKLEESGQQPVLCDVADQIATITFNRPGSMNSLDLATKEALLDATRTVGDDPGVRCVVLTGTGRAFCVGQDLREHASNLEEQPNEEVWSTVERHFSPIAATLVAMEKPVIAAINGVAAGAGMSLAMLCDLRIAADTASFNTAFTGIGLSCDTGCSWTLPRLVGPTKAMEMLLMPRSIDAIAAQEMGLVTTVVPIDNLATETARVASQLANGATLAYSAVRQSIVFGSTHSLLDTLTFEGQMMAQTGSTDDHRKAVASFLAKEKPTFVGR
jgi:2-(1,2-epoxy-1,2-dihydrophenyl)acetyl-CoA isomerase